MYERIIIIAVFFPFFCYSQQFVEHRFDSRIIMALPENYRVKDTLNLEILSTDKNEEYIINITEYSKSKGIENLKDLPFYYEEFQIGFLKSVGGKKISEELVHIDGLIALKFKYGLNEDNDIVFGNLIVYLDNTIYSVLVSPKDLTHKNITADLELILSSIKINKKKSAKNEFVSELNMVFKESVMNSFFIFLSLITTFVSLFFLLYNKLIK